MTSRAPKPEPMRGATDGGDTTETDSECESGAVRRVVKRELRPVAPPATPAESPPEAVGATTQPFAEATALPPGVAPNSILAVMLTTPVVEPPLPSAVVEPEQEPPLQSAPDAQPRPEQNEYCALCTQKFKTRVNRPRHAKDDDLSCACCERTWLKMTDFSHTQRSRAASERRCRVCTQGDQDILDILRGRSRVTRDELVEKNVLVIKEKQEAAEKRRTALAKRKLERQQQEEEDERERAAHAGDDAGASPTGDKVIVIEEDASHSSEGELDEDEAMQRMEKDVRDILAAVRSIHRRRQVIDLDGPDREDYELQLLNEETKLHEQAASLCLKNPTLYDRVCEKVLVIDGKVKLGERDHEQGDFDGDKPNHRVSKNGKIRVVRKKPDNTAMERGESLLRGARAIAERRRVALPDTVEPPRKRVRRVNEDGIEMAVLNRPRRRVAKPAIYVIDSD